ncbi:MAG: class I SAM-dependent methyltransferase [Puia sp.]|nr:class I SAM-dependent methyltransferase [Puia sp.]
MKMNHTGMRPIAPSLAEKEKPAAVAFSAQAPGFDACYAPNTIIQYKRARVRAHVEQYLPAESNILELNAGTGEDAIYFAGKGHRVHATDISEGMLKKLEEKVERASAAETPDGGSTGLSSVGLSSMGLSGMGLKERITRELCSFHSLDRLAGRGPYDLVFSNFAGLNCSGELDKVLRSCTGLLKPGGLLTVVLLPRFCALETLLLFKGQWKTAFRRFCGSKGTRARVEGHYFRCWYYNPSYVKKALKDSFTMVGLEGLCTIVPPSYIEGFAEKYPRLYPVLCRWEDRLKSRRPWKGMGDYYIITFRKRTGPQEGRQ